MCSKERCSNYTMMDMNTCSYFDSCNLRSKLFLSNRCSNRYSIPRCSNRMIDNCYSNYYCCCSLVCCVFIVEVVVATVLYELFHFLKKAGLLKKN